MTLEKQVCSLEYARRLKELGVPQESLFYWVETLPTDNPLVGLVYHEDFTRIKGSFGGNYINLQYSAFTVAELGELLPRINESGWFESVGWQDYWRCNLKVSSGYTKHFTHADTEADARAKMLIYLLENKLI